MKNKKQKNFLDENIDLEKREFLKKLARNTAYTIPVMMTFSMSSFSPRYPRSLVS